MVARGGMRNACKPSSTKKMKQLKQHLKSAASIPAQEDLKRQIAETEARHRETLKSLDYNLY